MYARNRRTGSPIEGTHETLTGRADVTPDTYKRNHDNTITHEYDGYTNVFWHSQLTTERQNEMVYLDADGNEVVASEVELVESLDEPLTAPENQPPVDPAPALENARKSDLTDTVTLYEVVHRTTGAGYGLYTSPDTARENARPTDLVAQRTYRAHDAARYAPEPEPIQETPEADENEHRQAS